MIAVAQPAGPAQRGLIAAADPHFELGALHGQRPEAHLVKRMKASCERPGAAAARDCAFEWYAHESVARRAGLTQEELDALRRGECPSTLSTSEVVTHDTVVALLDRRDLDDAQFERARDALGLEQLVELVTLTGYYDLLALSLRVFRVPLPDDAVEPPGDPRQ